MSSVPILASATSSLAWTACSPCPMAWWPSLSPCLSCNLMSAAKLTDPASASKLAAQLGKGADSLISYVLTFITRSGVRLVVAR